MTIVQSGLKGEWVSLYPFSVIEDMEMTIEYVWDDDGADGERYLRWWQP